MAALLIIMAFRIKNKKLNTLWPITILKFCLPFFSYTFFGQSFLLLSTIFNCYNGHLEDYSINCVTGTWNKILNVLTGIALFLQSFLAILTNFLYYKPIFFNSDSDLLKKTNSFPDTIFIFTKIGINLLFILQQGEENQQWLVLFFSILFSGVNAYYYLYYKNRINKVLSILNNIFSLILVSAFLSLFVGKMFAQLEFTGTIYLFFACIIITFIYIFFYKAKDIDCISIDYKEIDNPKDYLTYIVEFNKIIQKKKNSRNYYTVLESLISKIEENCIILDCPLKKYNENMKKGIECPFLLNQFCDKLFEYGISKFPEDIDLKINYSIILTINVNYKNKALMILNSININKITFENSYYIYRAVKLIEKWNFSIIEQNNSVFEYKQNIQDFKSLIKKLTLLYYDFLSLLLNSKYRNNDSFNKIHKIGRQIMKINPKIDEDYNNLLNTQTDNSEIIKLYSEFVEGILCDEEKTEKCQNNSKITFSSKIEIHERNFTNFDIEILKEKANLPFIIISTDKDYLGKIIDLSMNILKIFGYSKNELIGKNINILIPKLFHKIHDLILIERIENDKLKLFDELNKRKIYFPDFIKKEIYGISKMKFLIHLNINIYFVKTESNKIIYIIEIENYLPKEIDLIKKVNNSEKYCVLTDENFLIQTFTPNCLDFLKLTSNEINSNFSIINYIKQFQEDYLTAINNTGISKFSHINKTELFLDEKFSDQKGFKNSLHPSIKKRIKNELFVKKYSKRCKITWNIYYDKNLGTSKIHKKLIGKSTDISSDISKSSIYSPSRKKNYKNNDDFEIHLYMEIEKIIIKNKVIGYYFYFSEIKNKTYNNMSYQIEKDEIKDNNYLTKAKKYQCRFLAKLDTNIYNLNKLNNKHEKSSKSLFSSFILKPPKKKDIVKNEINISRKKSRKKSLDKNSKVTFKSVDDNNPINTCSHTDKYYPDEDDSIITGEFIPSYYSHFVIDLKSMSFIQVAKKDNQLDFLEILKKEANNKMNIYKEKLQLLSKDSENSNESEEYESVEDLYSNSEINSHSYDENSLSNNSLYENIRMQSTKSNNAEKKNINNTSTKISKKRTKKDFQSNRDNNNNNPNFFGSSKKNQKKNSLVNSFYRVNLSNIHYMIYDYYKDMIIEGNKNLIVSKIEQIMINPDNNDLEQDERFYFIESFKNKNRKSSKEDKDIEEKKNIEKVSTTKKNNMNEEKLFKKRIHESLNKHKDEPPITRLKIFILLSYFILILVGILILSNNLSYLSRTSKCLSLFKNILFIKYCSQISLYYLREMSLLNFVVEGIYGGEYINIPSNDKEEYKKLIREQIMELFIENQAFIKSIYSSSLNLSQNSTKILSEYMLNIKMSENPKIQMKYDILTTLVQYNSAFYNLASSTSPILQNHTDLSNYIFNNLNEYKKAFNILIDIFQYELQICLNTIIKIVLIVGIILILFNFIIFFIIVKNFLSAISTRGNYMKVFYGINENILKNLIDNCENLINKLKSSEEKKNYDEENLNDTIEENRKTEENKKRQNNNITKNINLNNDIDNKDNNKATFRGIFFICFFGFFILITYGYFIFNGVYLINKIKNSIFVSDFCLSQNTYHIQTIEFFNVYREFLFDNQTFINGISLNLYLIQFDKQLSYLFKSKYDKYFKMKELFSDKSLCSYYINDFFDSSAECEETIGKISTYDFNSFSVYFINDIQIGITLAKYKFETETILGNLTEYNFSEYLNNELIPRQSEGQHETRIFRLELFNGSILHFNLNIKFFSIILPYIQENRKTIYNILTVGNISTTMTIFFVVFFVIVTLVYLCYFLPIVNFLNNVIYKTKNMLSIIPINILASQNGVSKLLNISKEK